MMEADASSPDLGALIAEHRVSPRAQREALWAGWSLVVAGVFVALLGLAVSQGHWPAPIAMAGGLPEVLIGVVVLVGYQRHRDLCVRLFVDGFTRTLAGQTIAVRWDEVAEVWQNIIWSYRGSVHTNTLYIYTVRLADGRKFVFNGQLEKIAGLGAAFQQQCAARILPRARVAYNAGAAIAFGPLSVSRDGIAKGNALLPWEQVEQVELRRGVLHIRKKEQRRDWTFAMESRIPNIPVLMAFVQLNVSGQ